MSNATTRVQKLWSYCTVLRDDGLSYQDYMEQLTMFLFLKIAEERAEIMGSEQVVHRVCVGPTSSKPKA